MKKYIKNISIVVFLTLAFSACDDVLNKVPLDAYSDGTVWADKGLSDYYLNDCYKNTMVYRRIHLSALSDECYFIHIKGTDVYLQGNISASNGGVWTRTGGYSFDNYSWSLYGTIQKINTFIANIDKIASSYEASQQDEINAYIELRKGEAMFLRAFLYTQLCRVYGGALIMKEPNELGDEFLDLTRSTFEETVNFIVEDCDNAAQLLKMKSETEMGRATTEAALALKSRILLFAASDLTADGTAKSEYVGYMNPDRTALWTAAKNAAKAVMDLGTAKLADFGAPDKQAVAENYYQLFKSYDLSNDEIIWGKMFSQVDGDVNQMNLRNGNNGNECYGSHCPTQGLIDDYEMEDGSRFFDHFALDGDGYYINNSSTYTNENPYYNREARFYGSVLYDSAVWQPRIYEALAERDPVGIYDRRTRRTVQDDGTVIDVYGLDTRQGPVDKEDGSYTGYLMKKTLDDQIQGYYENNKNVIIEFRYAEIILNYAEACLGLGETEIAATYINMIRNRAALPDFTGNITKALRHERKIEFVFEDKRWFDIRRWKILDECLTDALGMSILETTQGNNVSTSWQQINVQNRGPVDDKMYWIPVPIDEMNKAPQLVQNPGYQ